MEFIILFLLIIRSTYVFWGFTGPKKAIFHLSLCTGNPDLLRMQIQIILIDHFPGIWYDIIF